MRPARLTVEEAAQPEAAAAWAGERGDELEVGAGNLAPDGERPVDLLEHGVSEAPAQARTPTVSSAASGKIGGYLGAARGTVRSNLCICVEPRNSIADRRSQTCFEIVANGFYLGPRSYERYEYIGRLALRSDQARCLEVLIERRAIDHAREINACAGHMNDVATYRLLRG